MIEISREKMKSLSENRDVEGIYNTQIPQGLTLKDMEGYCPGAPGEVQLHYFVKGHPEETIVTDSLQNVAHQTRM